METIASGRVNERLSDDPTTRAIAWLTAWDTQGVRSGLIKYEGAERSVAYLPGTDGSNPSPSSGEMLWGGRRGDGTINRCKEATDGVPYAPAERLEQVPRRPGPK